jgi:hypothetical protein
VKIVFLTLLFTNLSFAWTLNNNFGASFKTNKINVFVDESTTCANINLTVYELESLISPAVNNFWNKVPTSNLRLSAAGFSPATLNINNGRLCSPTDDACITQGNTSGNLIPAVTDIIIACNSNSDNFSANNVLAITIPNKFSGRKIVGAIILINNIIGTAFRNLSKSDQISVISHEIGHALGLGHSEDSSALMYYRTVDQRRRLGQDDIDGISYLYPIGADLYGLSKDGVVSCGTIDDENKPSGPPPFHFVAVTVGALVLVSELIRLLKRSKTRSPT